jgi:hypothetical protein
MANFSSCGPTDDNRIKPDLTIPVRRVSAANDGNVTTNNCGETTMSGTSSLRGSGFSLAHRATPRLLPSGTATPGRLAPTSALGSDARTRQNMTGWRCPFPPTGAGAASCSTTPSSSRRRAAALGAGRHHRLPMGSSGDAQLGFTVNSGSVR